MKIEHVAINVSDVPAQGKWWMEHLGLRAAKTVTQTDGGPPVCYFLADSTGQVMVEMYHNDEAPIPDYAAMHPMQLHLAFDSTDVPGDYAPLIAAGATHFNGPMPLPDGGTIAMVRDPWGFPLQLADRGKRMYLNIAQP